MRRILASLLIAAPAGAQHATFLTPHAATVEVGQAVALEAIVQDVPIPWPASRIEHFFARTAWTQENRDSLEALPGMPTAAAWTADRPGVLLLGMELAPRAQAVPAPALRRFLDHAIAPERRAVLSVPRAAASVTILHYESAKAIVRAQQDGSAPASIASSKAGQPVEIRPLMDPTTVAPGADLSVRVYAPMDGARGGILIATNTSTGDTVRARADDSAIADIRIDAPGRWRLEFHAIGPPDPRIDAEAAFDLVLHTATLTFDVLEANP